MYLATSLAADDYSIKKQNYDSVGKQEAYKFPPVPKLLKY